MFGLALGVAMQYFNPRPRRLFVPAGGCVDEHRLCMDRFFGCSSCSEFVLTFVFLCIIGLLLLEISLIAFLKFCWLVLIGSAVNPYFRCIFSVRFFNCIW